jgi:virulence-associated protein VapD
MLAARKGCWQNKMKFITINGRILDYSQYLEEVSLLKKWIYSDLSEYLEKMGFEKKGSVSYNKKLDLEIKIAAKKRHKNKFV